MKYRLSFCIAAAALLAGCSIYHPQTVDIPLIDHKGDVRVDGSVGVSAWMLPDCVMLSGTVSYGFTDWLAGQAYVNYGFDNLYGQVAPGVYKHLNEHLILEGYAGFGMGGIWSDKTTDDTDTNNVYNYAYRGRYMLPFAQVNLGWRGLAKGHINLAFGLKAGGYLPSVDYRRFDENNVYKPEYDYNYSTPNLLLEPQVQFSVGGELVKYSIRLGFAWMSDLSRNGNGHFVTDFITISNGLTFSF